MPQILSTGQRICSSPSPVDITTGTDPVALPDAPMTPQRTAEQPAPAVANRSEPAGALQRGPESSY